MKRNYISYIAIFVVVLASATASMSQVRPPTPRGSQKASVSQTLGSTEITVAYSRPVVKGRKIFGDWPKDAPGEGTLDNGRARPEGAPLVPYGHIWRAGANEATLFTVADDVLINGQLLPAGKYSLHILPTKDNWTIIFNKDEGQWGSFSYDATKDALRVTAKPEWLSDSAELLTFLIDADSPANVGEPTSKGTVALRWEKVRVPFTVEVKDVVSSTMTRLMSYIADDPNDPTRYLSAAGFARSNKKMTEAKAWLDQGFAVSEAQIAKGETFAKLDRHVVFLTNLNRTADAIATGEKAIAMGKADPKVTPAEVQSLERRIAALKNPK